MLFVVERASQMESEAQEPPVERAHWDDMRDCWVVDVQTLEGLIALAIEENPRWHTLIVRAPVEDVPNGDIPLIQIEDTVLEDVAVDTNDK